MEPVFKGADFLKFSILLALFILVPATVSVAIPRMDCLVFSLMFRRQSVAIAITIGEMIYVAMKVFAYAVIIQSEIFAI